VPDHHVLEHDGNQPVPGEVTELGHVTQRTRRSRGSAPASVAARAAVR
jgi:hypothetical protein